MKRWTTTAMIIGVVCMSACGGSLASPTEPAATPTSVLTITGTNWSTIGVPALLFEKTPLGSSRTLPLFFRNTGTDPLKISGLKVSGGLPHDDDHFTVSPTSMTIAPNQTITVKVTFTPLYVTGLCYMETKYTVMGNQFSGNAEFYVHGDIGITNCAGHVDSSPR